jgi:hypothetical protein
MHVTLENAPDTLIDANGSPRWGRFSHTVRRINGREAKLRTPMGGAASAFARHFHYKQFQYFGIISDDLLIGCALANTAWIGLAFLYVYDTRNGKLHEYTWRSPFARAMSLSESPREGESRFVQSGIAISMGYAEEGDSLTKSLSIQCDALTLNASMTEDRDYQPMSLCTRTGINGWTYANKVAGVAVQGELHWNDKQHSLAQLNACGHHDFSAGYMRRETFWNWACLSGTVDGQKLGFNLSCGVNETSETENCLWLDGKLIKLNTVRFDYNQDNLERAWRIHTNDENEDGSNSNKVDLTFTPEGNHQEKLNLGLFASNFNQLFGRFNGSISLKSGATLTLKDQYGFVEEQFAKW